jgi:putative hydrolase of the HAD superfamily
MAIKNIVFDVGNVLVKWDPKPVVLNVFPKVEDPEHLIQRLVKSEVWFDLNKGKISEKEAIQRYKQELNLDHTQLEHLMHEIKESLIPVEGSFELVEKLSKANHPLYIITDNTHEIVAYLRKRYNFWQHFQGVVNSAELGILKPSPLIYRHLLETYKLVPEETIFFDDLQTNVDGALAVNMKSIQFLNSTKCIEELRNLNIHF